MRFEVRKAAYVVVLIISAGLFWKSLDDSLSDGTAASLSGLAIIMTALGGLLLFRDDPRRE